MFDTRSSTSLGEKDDQARGGFHTIFELPHIIQTVDVEPNPHARQKELQLANDRVRFCVCVYRESKREFQSKRYGAGKA